MSITFRSPTACRIVGVLQSDTASWPVTWGARSDDVADFDYRADGPAADWEHVEMAGAAVFLDDEGAHWLAHHLLIDTASDDDTVNAVALPAAAVEAIRREIALTEAWAAAKQAYEAVGRAWDTLTDQSARMSIASLASGIESDAVNLERRLFVAMEAAREQARAAMLAAL